MADKPRSAFDEDPQAVPTSRLGRIWKTGRTAAGLAATVLRRRDDARDLAAVTRLVTQLGHLRGLAMKGGQILSYVDPSLPADLRASLSVLQRSAFASDPAAIEATIRAELGPRAQELLAGMDVKPIAVASIGEVHHGTLPDGTQVAIKVRHPGIDAALRGDFASAGAGSAFASLLVPGAQVASFVDEAKTAILEECDFALEARRQTTFESLFPADPVLKIPHVEAQWCSASVLTTHWLPGRTLAELLASNPSQEQRDAYGVALFRFYVGTLYRHGLFHADPHPGNYGFRDDGTLAIYDFGCVRTFGPKVVDALADMVEAVRRDGPIAMRAALRAFGAEPPDDAQTLSHVRTLLRGFFAPLLQPGPRRIDPGQAVETGQLFKDKRVLMKLKLPGHLLFLFRLRFGLYSVISQLGACADWAALESGWANDRRPAK